MTSPYVHVRLFDQVRATLAVPLAALGYQQGRPEPPSSKDVLSYSRRLPQTSRHLFLQFQRHPKALFVPMIGNTFTMRFRFGMDYLKDVPLWVLLTRPEQKHFLAIERSIVTRFPEVTPETCKHFGVPYGYLSYYLRDASVVSALDARVAPWMRYRVNADIADWACFLTPLLPALEARFLSKAVTA